MSDTKVVKVTQQDLWELLLHGAVYDEDNDTEIVGAFRLEVDKTLRTHGLQVGLDADGYERVALVDGDSIVWTRPYDGYVQVDPIELPAAQADLFDPTALGLPDTADDTYSVEFKVVNISLAAPFVTCYVGVGIGGAAVGNAGWILRAISIPIRGATGWCGPYVLPGDDTLRGFSFGANVANIQFRIRQVNAGA